MYLTTKSLLGGNHRDAPEPPPRGGRKAPTPRFRRIPQMLGTIMVLPAAWLALLALVMLITEQAPTALVIGPAHIPDHAAITADPWIGLSLQSDKPGFVKELYANGAWLVLPAGLLGCAG